MNAYDKYTSRQLITTMPELADRIISERKRRQKRAQDELGSKSLWKKLAADYSKETGAKSAKK